MMISRIPAAKLTRRIYPTILQSRIVTSHDRVCQDHNSVGKGNTARQNSSTSSSLTKSHSNSSTNNTKSTTMNAHSMTSSAITVVNNTTSIANESVVPTGCMETAAHQPDLPQPVLRYHFYKQQFVHKISQIVLKHLQDKHHGWILNHQLETGLRINANGTFILQFPTSSGHGYDTGKIWTSYDAGTKQHWLSVYRRRFKARFLLREVRYIVPQPTITGTSTSTGIMNSVRNHNNNYPKRTTFKQAAAEAEREHDYIRHVVDQMIQAIKDEEEKVNIPTKNNN